MTIQAPREENETERGGLRLSVPGRAEAVRIVRSVMRSWASSAGYYLDEIDELCLAVDEAFAGLLATQPAPDEITVRIRPDGPDVDITAVRSTEADLWPPVSAQSALIRRVLSTLIDEVNFEQTPEGPAIRMLKRRTSVAGKAE
jgi:anti-sigma regulatory factor (Ser/Thr protein kinase)